LIFLLTAVYKDGRVCISILHEAKADEFNQQEKMSEKWRPILGPEAVLLSVLSMLSDPNFESPANVDASVSHHSRMWIFARDSLFHERVPCALGCAMC